MATRTQAVEGTVQILAAAAANPNFVPVSPEAWQDLMDNAENIFKALEQLGKDIEEPGARIL